MRRFDGRPGRASRMSESSIGRLTVRMEARHSTQQQAYEGANHAERHAAPHWDARAIVTYAAGQLTRTIFD